MKVSKLQPKPAKEEGQYLVQALKVDHFCILIIVYIVIDVDIVFMYRACWMMWASFYFSAKARFSLRKN